MLIVKKGLNITKTKLKVITFTCSYKIMTQSLKKSFIFGRKAYRKSISIKKILLLLDFFFGEWTCNQPDGKIKSKSNRRLTEHVNIKIKINFL